VADYVKRRSAARDGQLRLDEFREDDLTLRFPAVWEYMSLAQWEPGVARETTTFLLFCEQGWVKCCIHDRDEHRSAFVTAEGLAELLEKVNNHLKNEEVEWRDKVPGLSRRAGKSS
jgi:hypothetical protein